MSASPDELRATGSTPSAARLPDAYLKQVQASVVLDEQEPVKQATPDRSHRLWTTAERVAPWKPGKERGIRTPRIGQSRARAAHRPSFTVMFVKPPAARQAMTSGPRMGPPVGERRLWVGTSRWPKSGRTAGMGRKKRQGLRGASGDQSKPVERYKA